MPENEDLCPEKLEPYPDCGEGSNQGGFVICNISGRLCPVVEARKHILQSPSAILRQQVQISRQS